MRYRKASSGYTRLNMNWLKIAIFAVVTVTAVVAAHHWRKGAANIILPLTIVALYAVWRWRRDS
jgi:hypothetical protein